MTLAVRKGCKTPTTNHHTKMGTTFFFFFFWGGGAGEDFEMFLNIGPYLCGGGGECERTHRTPWLRAWYAIYVYHIN